MSTYAAILAGSLFLKSSLKCYESSYLTDNVGLDNENRDQGFRLLNTMEEKKENESNRYFKVLILLDILLCSI